MVAWRGRRRDGLNTARDGNTGPSQPHAIVFLGTRDPADLPGR
jgi:hypothetical protein